MTYKEQLDIALAKIDKLKGYITELEIEMKNLNYLYEALTKEYVHVSARLHNYEEMEKVKRVKTI